MPGWPRTGGVPVLLLAIPFAAYGVLRARRGTLRPAGLLLAAAFPLYALYAGNGLDLATGDNAATRALPSLLLTRGTLDLATTPPFDAATPPYAGTRVGARVLNTFPSGTAFVALPHAALALLGSGGRVTPALVSRWDKHAAAVLCVGAAGLLFLALRRWGDAEALGAATLFALASPVLPSAAQSLWSVTGELFTLCLALFLLLRARPFPATAGLAMALAFACRPTALVPGAAMAAALAAVDRRSLRRYAAALGTGVAIVAALQLALYGHPLGAYGAANTAGGAFNPHVASAIAGVLASPSRGLLFYCPWVLLVPLGVREARRTDRALFAWIVGSLAAAAGIVLLASVHVQWWGGWSLGPRLTTEAAPFLALACVPLFRGTARARATLLALAAVAAVTQLLLAYNPAASDWNPRVLDTLGPRSLWQADRSQLAAAWGAALPVDAGIPTSSPGGEGLLGSVDEPREGAVVTGLLRVRGWARIEGADLDVTIHLDGRARTPVSKVRVPRPEVCGALPTLGDCATAGYESVFAFGEGDGGVHEILVLFHAPDGRVRRYAGRSFVWKRD